MAPRTFYLTALLALLFTSLAAQNQQKADSLLQVYNSKQADSTRLKALNKLFEEYRYTNDELALKYLGLSVSLAAESNNTAGLALAFYNKGVYESEHGNFDSSDHYIRRSVTQYEKTGNRSGLAKCRMAFGFNRYDQGDFPPALQHFIEAAKDLEKTGNTKALSGAYIWIGNVYNNGLGQPQQALPYYNKALVLQEQNKDEAGMAFSYNNIGNAYYFLKDYPKALEYFLSSGRLKEKAGNRKGLSATYNNIGNVYTDQGDYKNALAYYQRSLDLRKEFGDKKGELTSYVNIGNVYIKLKNYKEAIQFHNKGLELAQQVGDKEGMKEAANSLSACYEALGDTKKAFELFKLSAKINDSLVNRDFNSRMAEMQVKYDTEKKDIEIEKSKAELMLKEEESRQKNIVIGAIIVLVLLLGFSALMVYRRRQTEQKARMDAELAQQRELRAKAIIEAEEKERIRIARDLHDGVGQLLSAAKMNLSSVQAKVKLADEDSEMIFKNAVDLLDESVREVRTVSHNMMPNTLLKMGLGSAVKEFVTRIQNTPNLKVNLEIVGLDMRLEQEKESVLYRVIQEVVSNIIKHAKASELGLQLVKHETELSIMIEDNGVGFDTSKIEMFEGIGLKNILSRVEFMGGSAHFDSAPGRGTRVIIDVPV